MNYRILRVLTHYMEMKNPPPNIFEENKKDCLIMKLEEPTIAFYRFLYKEVGQDITWVNRLVMEEEELYSIISDPKLEIYVLYYQGSPAGYAELDLKTPSQIELTYFGLMPRYRSKGLGTYLLNWTIKKAWSYNPTRFWLHTCELDHEAALPLYQKAGFNIYDKNMVDQLILD